MNTFNTGNSGKRINLLTSDVFQHDFETRDVAGRAWRSTWHCRFKRWVARRWASDWMEDISSSCGEEIPGNSYGKLPLRTFANFQKTTPNWKDENFSFMIRKNTSLAARQNSKMLWICFFGATWQHKTKRPSFQLQVNRVCRRTVARYWHAWPKGAAPRDGSRCRVVVFFDFFLEQRNSRGGGVGKSW